jgi:hypothetical protein
VFYIDASIWKTTGDNDDRYQPIRKKDLALQSMTFYFAVQSALMIGISFQ